MSVSCSELSRNRQTISVDIWYCWELRKNWRYLKMKRKLENTVTKVVASVLAIILTLQMIVPVLAFENQDQSRETIIYVTEESIDAVWDKLFDEEYDHHEFNFPEEAVDAFWQRLYDDAIAYLANLTDEEWADMEREFEEQQQAEQYFWDNFSPELLWEHYVRENPEVLRMHNEEFEDEEIKERIDEIYEEIISSGLYQEIAPFNLVYDIAGGAIAAWTRNFSDADGLGAVARSGIMADGAVAANRSSRQYPNNALRQDAWNYLAVTNPVVGLTAAARSRAQHVYFYN